MRPLEIANVECSGGEGGTHGNLTLGCYKKNILKIDKTGRIYLLKCFCFFFLGFKKCKVGV